MATPKKISKEVLVNSGNSENHPGNKVNSSKNPASDFKTFITDTFSKSTAFNKLINHHQTEKNISPLHSSSYFLGNLSGLSETGLILLLGNFFKKIQNTTPPHALFHVCDNEEIAEAIFHGIRFLFPDLTGVWHYPAVSELPGKLTPLPRVECHQRFLLERALGSSTKNSAMLIITSLKATLTKIPNPSLGSVPVKNNFSPPTSSTSPTYFTITVGEKISLNELSKILSENGYIVSTEVHQVGEYLIKSGIVDIFLPEHPRPYRIYFWDDEVEMIRPFDPVTQKLYRYTAKPSTGYP